MNIKRDTVAGTATITPTTLEEKELVSQALQHISIGEKFTSAMCTRDENDRVASIHLHAGGTPQKVVKTYGNVTVHSTEVVGGVLMDLRGTTADDQQELGPLRNAFYFGGRPTLHAVRNEDGVLSIVIAGQYCKFCGTPVITLVTVSGKSATSVERPVNISMYEELCTVVGMATLAWASSVASAAWATPSPITSQRCP